MFLRFLTLLGNCLTLFLLVLVYQTQSPSLLLGLTELNVVKTTKSLEGTALDETHKLIVISDLFLKKKAQGRAVLVKSYIILD
jgi:hypothetical protein